MAGIIVALGDKTNREIGRVRKTFEDLKDLKVSYEFSSRTCNIIKYKRRYNAEDANYFESPEIVLCAVGTVIYKNYSFQNSVKEIGKALNRAARLSKIAGEIDGHYCLVIVSRHENKCHIITDAGGVINTYLFKNDGIFFISSSMLAMAKAYPVTPRPETILMFLRSGMFFDDTTYFKEIEVLKPGSIYEYDFDRGQLQRSEYWSVPKNINEHISFEHAADSITKSVWHILDAIPNDKAIFDFTGGYDSRFVLSLAYSREKEKSNINAFFFGPPGSREARIVQKSCVNHCINYSNYVIETNWSERYFDYILKSYKLCDGLENACVYASTLRAQELKAERFQYSVHGLFGELFRQRTWEFELGRRGKKRPARLNRVVKYRNLADAFDKTIFSGWSLRIIDEVPNKILDIYKRTNSILEKSAPNTLQLDNIYFAQRARRWGGRNVTTANQLIQPICPLWFRKPLEISLGLPPEYKKQCKLMRYIVEKNAPAFANEKMITGTPFVLMKFSNIHRFFPGAGFFLKKAIRKVSQLLFNKTIWAGLTTPDYNTGDWYQQALKDPRCKNLLDWEKMVSRKFYNKQQFNRFIERAKSNDFQFYGQLGNIITVELTLRAANLKYEIGD